MEICYIDDMPLIHYTLNAEILPRYYIYKRQTKQRNNYYPDEEEIKVITYTFTPRSTR